jgi:hypothetical protein
MLRTSLPAGMAASLSLLIFFCSPHTGTNALSWL